MAFNFKIAPVQRTSRAKSEKSTTKKAIANRAVSLEKNDFIRDANELDDEKPVPSEAELLAAAWSVSPERTICALAETGCTNKEIAAKLGFKSDDPEFQRMIRSAQTWLKTQIVIEFVEEVPDSVIAPVVDSDGITHEVNIASKLKPAIVEAFFGKKMDVSVSAMKGARVSMAMTDMFNMSVDQIRKEKSACHAAYAKVFRTREAGEKRIGSALPPALAKFGVQATEESK